MQIGREHERYLVDPEADCARLRLFLGRVVVVGREEVWEVPVQVDPVCVVPSIAVLTLALDRSLESVGVHRGHQVDSSVFQQVLDILVRRVRVHQINEQLEEQLAADHLVSVHVCHVLDVRLQELVVVVGIFGYERHPELATLNRLADGVDAHQFREVGTYIVDEVGHRVIVVVGELDGRGRPTHLVARCLLE